MSQPPFTEPLAIVTNSFDLTIPSTFRYYQYDVVIKPMQDGARAPSTGKCNALFHGLQNVVAPDMFNPRMIYDGKKLAYCKVGNFKGTTFHVKFTKGDQLVSVDPTGDLKGVFQILLNKTSGEVVEPNDYKELVEPQSTALGPRSKGERAKNVIQLIIRQGPNLRHRINKGASYFNGGQRDVLDTGKGVELWRGIFLSVRPAPSRLILTVDTCATAVYRKGTLIDICLQYLNLRNVAQLDLASNTANFLRLEKFLSRLRVTVKIGGSSSRQDRSRTKIVRGLVANAGRFKFSKGPKDTTVQEHFHDAYNVHIKFPQIIGVSFEKKGSDRQNVVPAELCEVEAGQICNRIPDELRPDMVKFSAMKPIARKQRIIEEVSSYTRSEFLAETQMQVSRQMIAVNGRRLIPPRIAYKNQQIDTKNGAWNVKHARLLEGQGLENWAVLNLCRNLNATQVQGYAQDLANCCKALGMDPIRPPLVLENGNPIKVDDLLNRILDRARNNPAFEQKKPFIIIVLLEQDAGPIRTRIKYWGDISCGVLTQCLRQGRFSNYTNNNNNNNQYWNNVAIKINARLGGTNCFADSPFYQNVILRLGKYMIIGADVGHPGPGSQLPSVTSIVYSWDRYATKYAATTGIQHPRQEIIENFKNYVKRAITNFVRENGVPSCIFFFRDGVSEGEYLTVTKEEKDQLQAAIDELWATTGEKGPKPKITFLIVTKRHHAVFFPPGENDNNNCPPGLVVDSAITNPVVPNFYLQSHAAIQGTSRSSHYIVLQDDIFGYDLNKLQHLCYYLCHVYAKATRSVSIPAPVYYADLVCSRLMFHLKADQIPTSDTVSNESGVQFDLSAWQQAFQQLNPNLVRRMYFL